MTRPPAYDLFCAVVDNYGDIGVCWRLARQLVQEHGLTVRLWVDDLTAFRRLCPEIDTQKDTQFVAGVDIRHWDRARGSLLDGWTPGDVVIEAFACELPEAALAAMAQRQPHPVWINLEYLSAESWVREHHAMASPHPRLPLVRHFFFPGFEPGTGGLLRETGLDAQRDDFLASLAARKRLWHQLGVPEPGPDACVVSLFAYANRALPSLIAQWQHGSQPVVCLVPAGLAATQIAHLFGSGEAAPGSAWQAGSLSVHIVPFVRQEQYDELLWASDVNFVRGEDSFIRAQWAGKPFVWHIYPQEEDTHLLKLDAFLERYIASLPEREAHAVRTFWHAWNTPERHAEADWQAFSAALPTLRRLGPRWAAEVMQPGDLAANLVGFCENRVK